MSEEEPKRTWTDREIVLELFPATNERLVPKPLRYRVECGPDPALRIVHEEKGHVLDLTPVPPNGNPTGHLCCDLCQRSSPRRYLQFYRAELPGTGGRRFRYLTLCRDRDGCEARRLDDAGIDALVRAGPS